jgi:hypothetical protein
MRINADVKKALMAARKEQGLRTVGITDHELAAWGKYNSHALRRELRAIHLSDWREYARRYAR